MLSRSSRDDHAGTSFDATPSPQSSNSGIEHHPQVDGSPSSTRRHADHDLGAPPPASATSTESSADSEHLQAYMAASVALRALPRPVPAEDMSGRAAPQVRQKGNGVLPRLRATARGHRLVGDDVRGRQSPQHDSCAFSSSSLVQRRESSREDTTADASGSFDTPQQRQQLAHHSSGSLEADEEDEDAVAERVLRSLQSKDVLIAQLTDDVARATDARLAAIRERDALRTSQEEMEAALEEARHEARHWQQQCRELSGESTAIARQEMLDIEDEVYQQQERYTAELRAKEELLAALQGELRHSQEQWEKQRTTSATYEREAQDCRHRATHLQRQIEDLLHTKQQDVSVLREHIDHLQRELRDKSKEVKTRAKAHQQELAALQKEIQLLGEQFDAPSPATAARAQLTDELEWAKHRELQVQRQCERLQRQWVEELEAQKRIVDELQAASHVNRTALTQQAVWGRTQEAEATQAKADLQLMRVRLTGYEEAHARAEAEITRLRQDAQELTQSLAEATIRLTNHEQRSIAHEEEIHRLEDALQDARVTIAQKESEILQGREDATQQLQSHIAEEGARHSSVLSQIEGCAKSSERLEAALRTAELKRKEMEVAARTAADERDDARLQLRQSQAQSRKEMLEHQQLAATIVSFHQQKVTEAEDALREQTATAQHLREDMASAHNTIESLHHELSLTVAKCNKEEGLRAQLVSGEQKIEEALVQTKNELKEALTGNLALRQDLHDLEAKHRRASEQLQATTEKRRSCEESLRTVQSGLLALHAALRRMSARTRGDHQFLAQGQKVSTSREDGLGPHETEDGPTASLDDAASPVNVAPPGAPARKAIPSLLRAVMSLAEQHLPERWHHMQQEITAKRAAVLALQKEKKRLESAVATERESGLRACHERQDMYEQLLRAELQRKEQDCQRRLEVAVREEGLRWQSQHARESRRLQTVSNQLAEEIVAFVASAPHVVYTAFRQKQQSTARASTPQTTGTSTALSSSTPPRAVSLPPPQSSACTTAVSPATAPSRDPLPFTMDIMDECDTIAKELLGVAGGWEALQDAASGSGPPCHAASVEKRSTSHPTPALGAHSQKGCGRSRGGEEGQSTGSWTAEELQEMTSVVSEYVRARLQGHELCAAQVGKPDEPVPRDGSYQRSLQRLLASRTPTQLQEEALHAERDGMLTELLQVCVGTAANRVMRHTTLLA